MLRSAIMRIRNLDHAVLMDAMDRKGITQAELARRTGISRQHIHHIVHGDYNPRPPTKLKIVRALGYSDRSIARIFP